MVTIVPGPFTREGKEAAVQKEVRENYDIYFEKAAKTRLWFPEKLKEREEAKELIVSSAKELDHLFEMEKQVVSGKKVDHDPVEHGIEITNIVSFQLGRVAEIIGDDFERDTNFIKMHVMEIVNRSK